MNNKDNKDTLRVVGGREAKTKSQPTRNRELTSKQQCFLTRLIKGDTLIDSYEACYRTEGMSKKTAYNRAYELRHNGEIAGRLEAHNKALEAKHISNASRRFEYVLDKLQEETDPSLREDSTQAGRVAALRALGSISLPSAGGQSMFVERQSIEQSERSSDDVLTELRLKLASLND